MTVSRIGGLLMVGLLGAACGSGNGEIAFDPTVAPTPSTGSTVSSPPSGSSGSTTPGSVPTSPASTTTDLAAGASWVDATANLAGMESWCGNLAFVSARPDRGEVLVGVAGQGLFVGGSGSTEWVPFGRGEGSAPLDHRTSSIIYDPDTPTTFWESGFYGLGATPNGTATSINRTDDDGATFVPLGDVLPTDLLSIDFGDPLRQTMVVGIHGQSKVFRSVDGGATWTDISAGLPPSVGDASFPHVLDPNTYLLGTWKDSASGVFRTTDGGLTWTKVFDQAVSGPPLVFPGGELYWVVDGGGVTASTDGGQTWTLLAGRGPIGGDRRGRLVELPDGRWLSIGEGYMVVSSDRGVSWAPIGPALPFRPAGFTYSATHNDVFVWQNYCDFAAGPNPVLPESIMRLELGAAP